MADTACTSHWSTTRHGDCLHALADGWIGHNDLCPDCTRRFMAALDTAAGGPLPWHTDIRERSEPQ